MSNPAAADLEVHLLLVYNLNLIQLMFSGFLCEYPKIHSNPVI